MDIDERLLLKGFCYAIWLDLSVHIKRSIQQDAETIINGVPRRMHIPQYVNELFANHDTNIKNPQTEFEYLYSLCADGQQFINYLSCAIRWMKEFLLIRDDHIRIHLKNIDLSNTIPLLDFSNFELENIIFDDADLREARFQKTTFTRIPPHQERNYRTKPVVSFYMANIAGCDLLSVKGRGAGYDQYRVTGAFGNAAKNNLVGLTYPKERETHKLFRLFIDSDEILPADVIATALFLFSPNREIVYEGSNHPQSVMEAIAGESHRLRIISDAIIKASHSHPQSARNFEEACQISLFQKTQNNHDRFVVWRGLCLGR